MENPFICSHPSALPLKSFKRLLLPEPWGAVVWWRYSLWNFVLILIYSKMLFLWKEFSNWPVIFFKSFMYKIFWKKYAQWKQKMRRIHGSQSDDHILYWTLCKIPDSRPGGGPRVWARVQCCDKHCLPCWNQHGKQDASRNFPVKWAAFCSECQLPGLTPGKRVSIKVLKQEVAGESLALHGNSMDRCHWESIRLWKGNQSRQGREKGRDVTTEPITATCTLAW